MSLETWSRRSGRFSKERASLRSVVGHGRFGRGLRFSLIAVRGLLRFDEKREKIGLDGIFISAESLRHATAELGAASRGVEIECVHVEAVFRFHLHRGPETAELRRIRSSAIGETVSSKDELSLFYERSCWRLFAQG